MVLGLFSRGCTNHHYEQSKELNSRSDYRIIGGIRRKLKARVTYECQHDGCDATKEEWKVIRNISGREVDALREDEVVVLHDRYEDQLRDLVDYLECEREEIKEDDEDEAKRLSLHIELLENIIGDDE